jgi:hypothetical protein
MNGPEQNQIEHWFAFANEWIPNKLEKIASGRGKQSTHLALSDVYASLARAKFLNGDPLEEVRAEFANAARHVMKNFTMAYDESDPDYQGDQADLSEVYETTGIEGMNWALMSATSNWPPRWPATTVPVPTATCSPSEPTATLTPWP